MTKYKMTQCYGKYKVKYREVSQKSNVYSGFFETSMAASDNNHSKTRKSAWNLRFSSEAERDQHDNTDTTTETSRCCRNSDLPDAVPQNEVEVLRLGYSVIVSRLYS